MPFRSQALALLAVLLFCVVGAHSQATQSVDFRVMLVYADTHDFSTRGETSQPGVQSTTNSVAGEHPRDTVTNMQIRVQVLNSDGTTVSEQYPNNEGTARFHLLSSVGSTNNRQFLTYRIRVFGSEIQEAWVEDVQPGRGDSVITVSLHRKNEKVNQDAQGGLVSAADLKIPAKALKELEKGNGAVTSRKLPQAMEHFQKAVDIYPNYALAWNNLGVVKMKTGDLGGGKAAFEKALAVDDKFAKAYVNLARIDISNKEYAVAAQKLSKALAVEPLNVDALTLSCEAELLDGKTTEVVATSIKLHSLPHEGQPLCHYAAGVAYTNMNQPSEAENEYRMFLKESPENSLAAKAREAIQELGANVQVQTPKP